MDFDAKKLASLDDNTLAELIFEVTRSMGMSDDYEDAIAAGATMIRVGSAIFGARHYPEIKN